MANELNLGGLQYNIEADATDAEKALSDFSKAASNVEDNLKKVDAQAAKTSDKLRKDVGDAFNKGAKIVTGFATALVAAGVATAAFAAKEAAEFQNRMSDINTLLGLSKDQLANFSDEVSKVATRVPVDDSVLSASLYDIVSAGISDTSDALMVLEESARLGVAGLGDTGSAADLMTSAINAFGLKASDAADVSDVLFKTVKAGKTTIDELAQSFGQVAPIAQTTGVAFDELQAATAALTTSGLQTSVAQTQLRALFVELTRTGTDLSKALADVGITNVKAAIQSDGFVAVLDKLKKNSGLTEIEFANLFSSVEASGAAISLTGAQSEVYTKSLADMRSGVNGVNAAFETQMQDFDSVKQVAINLFQNTLKKIGLPIIESLTSSIHKLSDFYTENKVQIDQLAQSFGEFAGGAVTEVISVLEKVISFFLEHKTAAIALAGAVGGALVVAFGLMVEAAAPVIAAITAMAAAGAALAFFGKNIVDGINGLLGGLSTINKASDTTTKAIEKMSNETAANIVGLSLKGQAALKELNFNGGDFTDTLAQKVIKNAQDMSTEYGKAIDEMVVNATKSLQTLADAGVIDPTTIDERVKQIQETAKGLAEFNSKSTSEIQQLASKAFEIQQIIDKIPTDTTIQMSVDIDPKAKANLEKELGRSLTQEEFFTQYKQQLQGNLDEITGQLQVAQESITQNALDVATTSTMQLAGINARLKQDIAKIDADQTQTILQNAMKEREGVIAEANAKLEGVLAAAEQSKKAGAISEEEYIRAVQTATDERDGVVKAANEQTSEVLATVQQYAKDHGLILDRENGKLLTKQELFWESVKNAPGGLLKSMWETVVAIFKFGWKALTTYFNERIAVWKERWELVKTIVTKVWEGIKTFFTQTAPQWLEKGKEIANNVIKGIKNLPGDIYQWGSDTIQGFINGLKDKYESAVASVSDFGQRIINSIKEKLGIKSPSKVFREFGGFTAEGFLLGFEEKSPDAIAAMGKFVVGLNKETKKLDKKSLDFTGALEELQQVMEDSFGSASDAVRTFANENADAMTKIKNDIKDADQAITDLKDSFNKDTATAQKSFVEDAASIVIKAQDDLTSLQSDLTDLLKNQPDSTTATQDQIDQFSKEKTALEQSIADKQAIIASSKTFEINLDAEIQKQKDFNSLNELQQLQAKYDAEKLARETAYQEQLTDLENQKLALEASLAEREQQWTDFTSALASIDADFTAVYQDELSKREELTRASVDAMIVQYERLKQAALAAKSAGANIGSVGGFAEGGFTGSGSDTDVAGVVHKNEFVAPSWLVKAKPDLFSYLEAMRVGGRGGDSVNNNQQSFTFNVQGGKEAADFYANHARMRWLARFAT